MPSDRNDAQEMVHGRARRAWDSAAAFWISVVIVALVAGMAVAVVVLGDGSSADQQTSPPNPGASTQPASGDCQLPPEEDQTPPTEPPEVDKWGGNGALLVPMSDQYGPGQVKNGVHSCFSNGPIGALFAAAAFIADASNPTVTERAIRDRLLNPARAGAVLPKRNYALEVHLVGFRFVNYTPHEAAVIRLAYAANTEQGKLLTSGTYHWRWEGDHWRLVVPHGAGSPFTAIDDLDGFVKWGPGEDA